MSFSSLNNVSSIQVQHLQSSYTLIIYVCFKKKRYIPSYLIQFNLCKERHYLSAVVEQVNIIKMAITSTHYRTYV